MSERAYHFIISLGIFFLTLFSPLVFAFYPEGHFYASGEAGANFLRLQVKDPTIRYDNNLLSDQYPLNNTHKTTFEWGLKAGYEFITHQKAVPLVSLGLGFYRNVDKFYRGQVIETPSGDPGFLLYNYKANIATERLMAEMQLNWMFCSVSPFLNVGLGSSWNQASLYSESVATPDGFVAQPPFQSKTKINFAYQVGAGVGYAFNFLNSTQSFKSERVSIGYRYVDSGTVSFGTRGQAYPYSLNFGKLTSNTIFLTYTHLFS